MQLKFLNGVSTLGVTKMYFNTGTKGRSVFFGQCTRSFPFRHTPALGLYNNQAKAIPGPDLKTRPGIFITWEHFEEKKARLF